MPAKSRHGKGKHLPPSRRRPAGQGPATANIAPPPVAAAAAGQPVSTPQKVKARTTAPGEKPSASRYPYVGAELLRIAVLTVVMGVILAVLVFALPRG